MLTITKRIEWDMAHRLVHGYTSKCAHLHGHRYVAEVTFSAPQLDDYSMVLDFSEITKVCKGWIDEHIDHATLVCHDDAALLDFLTSEKQKHYTVDFNTTVEQITPWLAHCLEVAVAKSRKASGQSQVKIESLRVFETPTGSALWTRLNEVK